MNITKYLARLEFAIAALCITMASGSGCATHRTSPDESAGKPSAEVARTTLFDSSVDISYVLGHSHRRFVAWAKNESYGGQTLLDHQIFRESGIDRHHYSEYFGKVEQYVNTPRRKPADQGVAGQQSTPVQGDDTCRTPFTVTLRVGADTKVLQGCRGADDGTLSHLVRDGEFLLYSNK